MHQVMDHAKAIAKGSGAVVSSFGGIAVGK